MSRADRTASLTEVTWPANRLAEAIEALGRRSGLGLRSDSTDVHSIPPPEDEQLGPWIEMVAEWLGLEVEPLDLPYGQLEQLVRAAGPTLLRLPGESGEHFLAVLSGGRRIALLTPTLTVTSVPAAVLRAELARGLAGSRADGIDQLLRQAGVSGKREERARAVLRGEALSGKPLGAWLLRSAGAAGVGTQAVELGLPRLLLGLLATHGVAYGLWVLSWWILGWMALAGRFEAGWLLAWSLLLFTLIPFRLLTTRSAGEFSIRAGALLKRRLLAGALQMEPDEIRHLGAGQLLGRAIEADAIESSAIAGGFLGLTALVELAVAALILGAGAAGRIHVQLLGLWCAVTVLLGVCYYRERRRWTAARLDRTDDLVECMLGHRTRLAQQPRRHWNEGEDQALEGYLAGSTALDRRAVALQVLVPRGWFLIALVGLAPAFSAGQRSGLALAVAVGGIVLAYRAFRNLVDGLERLAGAALSAERIGPFWSAARRRQPIGHPRFALPAPTAQMHSEARCLLDARDLIFRHRGRAEPTVRGVDLQIRSGDRLLLQGPSAGGKSTLAALLAGARLPESGLLLLRGLDRETLGAGPWRRRVVIVPQFHDNHVLVGTFAFNVLLGRGWPPQKADLDEAEAVCRALGLGPLLDRMPAGLNQVIGETGWQLSHGEKGRLFLARALLQRADLLILDESFAALDPPTLRRTLAFVLEKAPTVVVIAHP